MNGNHPDLGSKWPIAGESVDGPLVRIDDSFVTVGLADGTARTFRREGDVPKVEVHDPMKAHSDLLAIYTDKDMHDVTAYLVTLPSSSGF